MINQYMIHLLMTYHITIMMSIHIPDPYIFNLSIVSASLPVASCNYILIYSQINVCLLYLCSENIYIPITYS